MSSSSLDTVGHPDSHSQAALMQDATARVLQQAESVRLAVNDDTVP